MAKDNTDVSNGWPVTDVLFCEDRAYGLAYCITPRQYFLDHGCLHDCFDNVVGIPDGFHNTQESGWEYLDGKDGRALLEAAGAVYSVAMDKYING